jgi:hypothetical protein
MRPNLADPKPRPSPPAAFLLLALLLALPGISLAWGRPAHRLWPHGRRRELRPAARAEALRCSEPRARQPGCSVGLGRRGARRRRPQARSTRRWHFVDFRAGGCEYLPARDCPDGDCVVEAIQPPVLALADRRRPTPSASRPQVPRAPGGGRAPAPACLDRSTTRAARTSRSAGTARAATCIRCGTQLIFDRALQAQALDETGYLRTLQATAAAAT